MRVVLGIQPISPPAPRIIRCLPFPEGCLIPPNVPPVTGSSSTQAKFFPSLVLAQVSSKKTTVCYLPYFASSYLDATTTSSHILLSRGANICHPSYTLTLILPSVAVIVSSVCHKKIPLSFSLSSLCIFKCSFRSLKS